MLLKWDGVMAKDRPEPLDLHRLPERAAQDPARRQDRGPDGRKRPFCRDHPHFPDARPTLLVQIIPGPPDPDCRKALGRALDDGLALLGKRDGSAMSQWEWGAEHQALLRHQVYAHIPLFDRLSNLSLPRAAGSTPSIAAAAPALRRTCRSPARSAAGFAAFTISRIPANPGS